MKKLIFLFFVFISFNSYSQDIKKISINLYPNPATDYIIVKFENNINVDDFDFKIHSLIGNQLNFNSEKIYDFELRVDIQNLSKGVFFLIINERNDRNRKIVKFLKN